MVSSKILQLSSVLSFALLIHLIFSNAAAAAEVNVTDNAHSAAIVLETGDTRIYYQADDTSIHEVRATNVAGGTASTDTVILDGFIARAHTPLAAIQWDNFANIYLFYIGISMQGRQLRQLVWSSTTGQWTDGSLNANGYGNAPGRQWLYAIGGPTETTDNIVRVGFVCDELYVACEASNTAGSSGSWGLRRFT